MASVPITVLVYNGQLLCSFYVPFKGLTCVLMFRYSHYRSAVLIISID